ncbi:MAG: VWA domain-containing protein [Bacteroidales bacterium]|nr:VWA domain-containing protein [Bacteroidales bacterium]
MIKYTTVVLFIVAFGFNISEPLHGQNREREVPLNRVLIIFDASNSMYGYWQSDRKITIARNLLVRLVDSLKNVDNVELALRVYGHLKYYPPQDCDDTKLEVPFAPSNTERIKDKLKSIVPKGTTPIARSLEAAVNDFPPCDNCRNIIVLITDGIEECDGDPCAVSRQLQKSGIILKPFIIGIGRDFKADFDCVGKYFDASSEHLFRQALNVVISQALNSTTAQVNLLDDYNRALETNVAMTLYDHFSGEVKYNFIHTLNSYGVPDTIVIDPLTIYDIEVHTIPPVRKDSVKLLAGKHNVIPIPTPQGFLDLRVGGTNHLYKDLLCIVKQPGIETILHVQPFNAKEKYLTGLYNLEILTLPRIVLDAIEIKQNHTTEIVIPVPGLARISYPARGFGNLFWKNGNTLINIYRLNENATSESIVLQPGEYSIVFRAKYAPRTYHTIYKSFTIDSGKSTNVQIK